MQSTIKKKLFPLAIILLLAIGLVPQPTKAEEGSGVTIYVVPAITDEKILPTTSISSNYMSNEISIVASPGEYEPASFVIRANDDVSSLQVSATNLTGASGTIPSSNVDIRVVKCWYQGGYTLSLACNGTYLTPELLLKDDSLVSVVGSEWNNPDGQNYLKLTSGDYIWISEKGGTYSGPEIVPITDRPVSDSFTLQPVAIPSGTNKQFWLTVKVPDDAPAGMYHGTVELRIAGGLIGQLQLELEVLPIELSEPYLTYGIYYRGKLSTMGSISSENKTEEQFRAEMVDILNHGVTSPTIYGQGGLAILGKVLTIRDQVGMSNQSVYCGNGDADYQTSINYLKSHGVTDIYFYFCAKDDRVMTEQQLEEIRARCNEVHGYGGKVFAGLSLEFLNEDQIGSLADVLDLALVNGEPSVSLVNKYHSYGHKIWNYANPQVVPEFPETFRRNYGLLLWQRDYDGAMPYAYQHSYNDIWNDFDNWGAERDHVFAYPTMDGVIDTVQWEGFREGVDDIRYLTTLLQTIEEAKAEGKDTAAAENWLAELKSSDLTTENLDAVRSQMICYILSFVVASPSDVTPPVITSIAHSAVALPPATTITWTTDERANSQVEYGTTQGLGLSTDLDTSLVCAHEVALVGLNTSTTYYFRVKSSDASGNLAISDMHTLSTIPSVSISFAPPTDADKTVVGRNWTDVSVSVDSTYEASSFIDWNRSLVGYWDCNDNSGTIVHDKSTYGNNGTLKNGSQWTAGKFGSALGFDGVDDYVEVPDTQSLDITDAITIEAWVYLATDPDVSAQNDYRYILGKKYNFPYSIILEQNRIVCPSVYIGGVRQADWNGSKVPIGVWTYIAFTFDGRTGAYNKYFNGELDVSATKSTGRIDTNNDPIYISCQAASPLRSFPGLIDEVRIWNRALSLEEIRSSYNTNINSLSHKFTGLSDGTYQYYAYATDLTGNSAKTETRTISVNTTVIPGDANGDGRINTADLTILERIIVGLQSPTSGADVNQDGRINTADITGLERMIGGMG